MQEVKTWEVPEKRKVGNVIYCDWCKRESGMSIALEEESTHKQ
jgi:hypothetical protein